MFYLCRYMYSFCSFAIHMYIFMFHLFISWYFIMGNTSSVSHEIRVVSLYYLVKYYLPLLTGKCNKFQALVLLLVKGYFPLYFIQQYILFIFEVNVINFKHCFYCWSRDIFPLYFILFMFEVYMYWDMFDNRYYRQEPWCRN